MISYIIYDIITYNIIHDIITQYEIISCIYYLINDIILLAYDIIYYIIIILQTPNPHGMRCSSLAAANLPPAQHSDVGDGGNDPDREMDPDEARDYADQGPLPERDMEDSGSSSVPLTRRCPSCTSARLSPSI